MPNNLHVEAIVSNSTDVFYFKHPNTAVYAAGTPKANATGTFTNDFTGVTAGNYGPVDPSVPAANRLVGTVGAPSATNTTVYTYVGAVRTVLDAAVVSAPASAPAGAPTFALADPTIGRVDRSVMSLVSVTNATDLRNYLAQNLTNTRLKLADGDYTGYFEQTGNWTNVELASDTGSARLLSTNSSTNLLFQGGAARKNVALSGFKILSTMTGTGYPQLWWNELGLFDGLEFAHLDISGPNGAFNAVGCVQYSTSSQSGQIAKNILLRDMNLHDVGRVGIELLSQGYDGVFRLLNLAIQNNRFANLGLGDAYGMATSLSGLFKQIDVSNNVAIGTRRIGYEFVNTQQAVATNNSLSAGKDGVGYGISDDGHGLTQDLYISGGSIDAPERPFYAYDSKSVHIDGQGKLWKGHRGVDLGSLTGSSFTGMNVLIQSTAVETGWQFGGGCVGNSMTNSTVSSAGSAAAGYNPSFEQLVLRSGATNNTLDHVTTILGLQANGTAYAGSPATGADGRIVDQGAGNTLTNNTASTAA